MFYAYIRVSTAEQSLQRQREAIDKWLAENDIDSNKVKYYEEKKSGKNVEDREVLSELINHMHENDTLIIEEISRLSRNYEDIGNIMEDLRKQQIDLVVTKTEMLSTRGKDDATSRLIADITFSLFSFMAEQEREELLRRQKQGIEIAKEQGRYKGRDRKYSPNAKKQADRNTYFRIKESLDKGVSVKMISNNEGVARNTVYTIKKEIEQH